MDVKTQSGIINLKELESLARERLGPMAFDYYASGACDEITLADNELAYQRIKLLPHAMVDVSDRQLGTTVFGQSVSMPVLLAPTAFQKLAHPQGESAAARAARRMGTVYILSTLATSTIEEVSEQAGGSLWFQLYIYKDRGVTRTLVERAEKAGYGAIVLTVDTPLLGRREKDMRNNFQLPDGLSIANLDPAGMGAVRAPQGESGLAAYFLSLLDPALTWKELEWLRSITSLPIVVKGILRAEDARRAVQCGAQGIIVSNHGGRQLDTVPATITVLPSIVDAVGAKAEVLVDGGIRRGTDILKALAYGARAVAIGRPVLWGLAIDGEQGVFDVLAALKSELDLALALCGCPSVGKLGREFIYS